VAGADEPIWVEVLNASRKGREDWRTVTVAEMLLQERENPSFDVEGRFVAEHDRKPVGAVHANVDKQREERRGIIRFDVIPECRGRGIERRLVEIALSELRVRGMAVAQASVDSSELGYAGLLGELGFSQVRVGSSMEMELANIPHAIGENSQVAIRPLEKNQGKDIELFTWLQNETFREHFNFRPDTVEDTHYFLFSDMRYGSYRGIFFASLDNETVGFIGVGIDEKYNLDHNLEAGEAGDVFTIGVLRKHRRRGIGAKLMLHGLEVLKAKGVTKARLGVDDYNPTKAIKLYEKAGFKVKRKELIFEREL
jgi:ribosomal protein S18 acetylase RimI-like enzyme